MNRLLTKDRVGGGFPCGGVLLKTAAQFTNKISRGIAGSSAPAPSRALPVYFQQQVVFFLLVIFGSVSFSAFVFVNGYTRDNPGFLPLAVPSFQ